MRENLYQHFVWTRKSAGWAVVFCIVAPSVVGYFAVQNNLKYDFAGKRRGESLLRHPPPAPPADDE